ncbi:MAG: cache domain-containing protein, partial [Planctomycetaceae bacterium]|nr:cache domain-containing protein [Planctomycetaceae bacterium]
MNPLHLLTWFSGNRSKAGPHMTFAKTRASHTIARTALLLKRQLWIWPIIAIIVLTIAGYWVRSTIQRTMKLNLHSQLQTLLDVEIAMVDNWRKSQTSNSETMANDKRVRELVYKILSLTHEDQNPTEDPEAATRSVELPGALRELRQMLSPAMTAYDYTDFFLTNRSHKILASSNSELIGKQGIRVFDEFLQPVMEGGTTISPPFSSMTSAVDEFGETRTGLPTMFVCAPVRDDSFQVVGALAFRMRPEQEFTRILQLGRLGESGETYAFNKAGVMVSNSRFDESLILMGIIPDTERSKSILNVHLRDPGQDLSSSGRPKVRRSEMPLTKMAAAGTSG